MTAARRHATLFRRASPQPRLNDGTGAGSASRLPPWRAPPQSPPGFVLLAAILLVAVAGLALAAGTAVAAHAVVIARGRADAVRARLAAEAAVRLALAGWRAGDERALPLLGERALAPPLTLPGGAVAGVRVIRLGGDLYLLRAEGRSGVARARAGAVVRVLSVASLLAPFPAAIAGERVRLGASARVRVAAPVSAPPGWSSPSCDPAAADSLAAVFGSAARPGVAAAELEAGSASIDGEPPAAAGALDPDTVGFGPLSWERLAAVADRTESGAVRLAPVERADECDRAAAGNWGAPLDPATPCGGFFPLVYAPGDLRVLGGAGQGVLVVRGRLELQGDTHFYGAIFVGGHLEAEPGVALWGAARAGSVSWAGDATYAACTLLRALGRSPGLGHPWRTGARLWVPMF